MDRRENKCYSHGEGGGDGIGGFFSLLWKPIVEEDKANDGHGGINDFDNVHIIVMKGTE